MKSRARCLLPLLVALLVAGCLEFAGQTVSFQHDPRTDTLRIFQDYHGIFGADQTNALSAQELEQLDSVLKTQRTFFFANWIFEFDRNRFFEDLADLKDPEKRKDKEKDLDEDGVKSLERLLRAAVNNIHVENGDFYRDAHGRLCGVQRVTITNASKLVAALNGFIPALLRSQAKEESRSSEERAALRRAAERGGELVQLRGNTLKLRWPMPRSEYDALLAEKPPVLQAFRKSGGKISFEQDEMHLEIGPGTQPFTTVTLPVSSHSYVGNVIPALQGRAQIRASYNSEEAARKFVTGK